MANTSSAKNSARKSAARTEINKSRTSRMRTFIRKVEEDAKTRGQLSRFLPPHVVEQMVNGKGQPIVKGGRARICTECLDLCEDILREEGFTV